MKQLTLFLITTGIALIVLTIYFGIKSNSKSPSSRKPHPPKPPAPHPPAPHPPAPHPPAPHPPAPHPPAPHPPAPHPPAPHPPAPHPPAPHPPAPHPPPSPSQGYSIQYPPSLDNGNQSLINNYLKTLYPLYKNEPSNDLWKTLDFIYLAGLKDNPQKGTDYAQNSVCGITYNDGYDGHTTPPQGTGVGNPLPFIQYILNRFRSKISNDHQKLNNEFQQTGKTSYMPLPYDIVGYPFTSPTDVSVNGLFINRLDPDNLFDPAKNIGYCATGFHKAEIAKVANTKGISAYQIGKKDKDGNILGFKDNMPIEIIHKNTHYSVSNINDQFFDGMAEKYGVYLYYGRGSGVFFNPGRILNARNKIDAIRLVTHYSKTIPDVPGWNSTTGATNADQWPTPSDSHFKAGDKNPYHLRCPNTMQGWKNVVDVWGYDADLDPLNDGDDTKSPAGRFSGQRYPQFLKNTGQKYSCTEYGHSYFGILDHDETENSCWDPNHGYKVCRDHGFLCSGMNPLLQEWCCTKGGGTNCDDGNTQGTFQSVHDDDPARGEQRGHPCNLAFSYGNVIGWRALQSFVPDKDGNGQQINDEASKLAWLYYVCCNGIDDISGPFNTDALGGNLNEKQKKFMELSVAYLANIGGVGDEIYISGMVNTLKDQFDSLFLIVQPESTGVFSCEIFTFNYDNSASKFSTLHPENSIDKVICKFNPNPAGSEFSDDDATPVGSGQTCSITNPCCSDTTSCTSNAQGICIANSPSGGDGKCEGAQILTCDKVSWATPYLSFPIWPSGQTPPFNILKPPKWNPPAPAPHDGPAPGPSPGPTPPGSCPCFKCDNTPCGKGECQTCGVEGVSSCPTASSGGCYTTGSSSCDCTYL